MATANTISKERLAALIASARAIKSGTETVKEKQDTLTSTDKYGNLITYNTKQREFVDTVLSRENVVLIGAAGTGKTTAVRGAFENLIQTGKVGILEAGDHDYLPKSGTPGIVACSFTRRAVNNLKRAMPPDLQGNCITLHKLLEYKPVYYEVIDEETGKERTTMRFEATRNAYNPLPATIQVIAFDESSMISYDLFMEVMAACPHNPQLIFMGDIQQLPPVFGKAVLGYRMLDTKIVELTEVYRQALESPIIRLAHRILSGKVLDGSEYPEWKTPEKLTLHAWKKKLSPEVATLTAAKFFNAALDSSDYNPDEDMILIPYNKSFGTDELNKHIAQHIARTNNRPVYEVIAGFNYLYFSVGDKVLVDKEDAVITSIIPNPTYLGKSPQDPSTALDYWGFNTGSVKHSHASEIDVDLILSQAASDVEDRVAKASHIVTVRLLDSDTELKVETAAALNSTILSYALTVHKSQGSEWRKVFLVLHQSHAKMVSRELLYTAVTRAREELYVICEPESFTKGITSQRIKGNTLAEKAAYFKGIVERDSKEEILE